MSLSPLPVHLRLLADRQLGPGAVRLVLAGDACQALEQLVAQPDFAAFAAVFPCLVADDQASHLPPATLQALRDAGGQLTGDTQVQRFHGSVKPVLRPETVWLDGDWYLAPPAKTSGGQSASRVLALKLVQLVAADADTRDIEEVFRQDPALSYHLLRLVNSLGMGATRPITSFSQAILILGRQQLRRWLNLMLFASRTEDHRSAMLLARVTLRARSMELLAQAAGLDHAGQELSFMAGMFSLLGVLFGLTLAELFKPLQLSEVLLEAVLWREGEIGRLLQAVELAEQGDGAGLADLPGGLKLDAAQFSLLHLAACQWMLGIVHDTQGGIHA